MTLTRRTLIVHGRLAMRETRVSLARSGVIGTAVMTFEQAAARLAGGFSRPIDADTLRQTIHQVLPHIDLGELEAIKSLPGMTGAAANTLQKAWRSGLKLEARAPEHARLAALADLEEAVVAALPAGMLRPCDLAAKAIGRIEHAPAVLGALEINGLTEMSPCWRPLLKAMAAQIPVQWNAGPRHAPEWLDEIGVDVIRSPASKPAVAAESAATTLHEATEALRWARQLIATGRAKPAEIAIAAASPSEYDEHFLTLRADANLDVCFVHGVSAMATRDGQAAAALAELLMRGLSQTRLRRLATLCRDAGPFQCLPERWTNVLPANAPLTSARAWNTLLAKLSAPNWPDGVDHTPKLRAIIEALTKGMTEAEAVGRAVLPPVALKIWMRGLQNGPPAAIAMTLSGLRLDDSSQAPNAIAWMPASALAASPRPFVRLLGLTSRAWPRLASEDRLLPAHVIPANELEPLPVSAADRRDFQTILATTQAEVVLSRPRRDGEGRLLGNSPLLQGFAGPENYLQRNQTPEHAMSEADRLAARPDEYRATPLAKAADACWTDWQKRDITGHDGLIRPGHPMIAHVLDRLQSATSLRILLRDPVGFVWRYALGWKAPHMSAEPLTLEHREYGAILHKTLEGAVNRLEKSGGLAGASQTAISDTIAQANAEAAADFEADASAPPVMIWKRTLDEIRLLASDVIRPPNETPLPGQRSFAEVPFSDSEYAGGGALPWDPKAVVSIPGGVFRIRGAIDRIDLSGDGSLARVSDYKTGRAPKRDPYVLDGGKELQRCLYSFAVKALLGTGVRVEATLRYPRSGTALTLENAEATLKELTEYLVASRENLIVGRALPGPDTAGQWNDLAFALPANAPKSYYRRKQDASTLALGAAASVWEVA